MPLCQCVFWLTSTALAQTGWPASGPELCVVPATLPIRPTSTCADYGHGASCEDAVADVAAQRGEAESVQLLLRRSADLDTAGGLTNVSVAVVGLPATVAATSVFQVGFVHADHSPRYQGSGGGWRPDPLLPPPAPGTGFDVAPGDAQPVWVELRVLHGAAPGVYNASLVLSCGGGACGALRAVPLRLTVWPSALPSLATSVLGTAWSGAWNAGAFSPYYGAAYWANDTHKHRWYDLLLNARTPPDAIYQSPSALRNISDYVYLASKGVQWFAILDVTSLPLTPPSAVAMAVATETWPRQQRSRSPHGSLRVGGACANYTQEYVDRLISTLEPIMEALEAAGIAERAYIYGFDECPVSCEPQVRQLFGATKARWPALRTSAVLNWSPMPVDLPLDVWILQYQEFNGTDSQKWAAAGKTQWQYHCIEPHSLRYLNTFLERRPIQPRLLFWLAALNQAEYGAPNGWLYYAVNLWRPCASEGCGGAHTPAVMRRVQFTDPADPRSNYSQLGYTDFPPANFIWQPRYDDIFANGDGQYVYPCEGGPCGTTRLASIRDGLEDWELFAALGGAKAAPLLRRLVRSPSDWTEDAALLEATRREAAAMLHGESGGRQGGGEHS